jgi:hypothetical protein
VVGHQKDLARGARVGHIVGLAMELDDALVAFLVRVVDVEQAALGVVRREREPQQALLAARGDEARDVQERRGERLPAADDLDLAALLDDEEPALVARR